MDQFRQVLPGETLPGFPGRAWNKMLEGLSQNASGPFAGLNADGPIEISVKNTTGAALGRFAILGIATPTITKANDANQFYVRDLMDGIAPTATSTIVITQTTLDVNEIGKARVMGLARVQVDITDETHTHAVPTTSTTQLTSGASGPAKILHKESAGTGVKWCVVALTNNAAAGSGLINVPVRVLQDSGSAITITQDAAANNVFSFDLTEIGLYEINASFATYIFRTASTQSGAIIFSSTVSGSGTVYGASNSEDVVNVSDVHSVLGSYHDRALTATFRTYWVNVTGAPVTVYGRLSSNVGCSVNSLLIYPDYTEVWARKISNGGIVSSLVATVGSTAVANATANGILYADSGGVLQSAAATPANGLVVSGASGPIITNFVVGALVSQLWQNLR